MATTGRRPRDRQPDSDRSTVGAPTRGRAAYVFPSGNTQHGRWKRRNQARRFSFSATHRRRLRTWTAYSSTTATNVCGKPLPAGRAGRTPGPTVRAVVQPHTVFFSARIEGAPAAGRRGQLRHRGVRVTGGKRATSAPENRPPPAPMPGQRSVRETVVQTTSWRRGKTPTITTKSARPPLSGGEGNGATPH